VGAVDVLRDAVRGAASGRGALVFVTGEPGIGKTTVAHAAVTAASAAGADVLWAACWQDDQTAHGPWRSVLAELGEPASGALSVLSGAEQLDPSAATAARAGAYARVVDTLTSLSRQRPIVVVLDDLHWADDGSVRLLGALRGRLPATPMLVVGTYRDNEVVADSPLAAIAAVADRIALAPLAPAAVAAIIEDDVGSSPDEQTVADVLRRTGGNPFLVVQVSRLLAGGQRDALPAGARDVLRRRLEALPARVREVLEAGAVLGGAFQASTVSAVVDCDAADALDALDAAAAARVVHRSTSPGAWEFVHDLFRQAVLDALSSTRSVALHAAAASVLIDLSADPATIAHHALHAAAGADVEAAGWAMRAAQAALDAFAWEDAAAHAESALAVLPSGSEADAIRAEAWLTFGRARLLAGDRDRAVAAFTTAAALGRSIGSADLLARAALGFAADLGGFEVRLFDQRQIDLLEEAAAALAAHGDPSLRGRLLARLSVALSFAAPTERRLALAEQAVALARSGQDHLALAGALAAHCDAIAGPDDTERRLAESTEIIQLAEAAGDGGLELLGRRLRFVALLERGEVTGAFAEGSAFARRAAEVGNPLYSWYVPLWRGMWALASGDVAGAEDAIAEVMRVGERAGSENAPMLATVLRSEVLHHTQRIDEMGSLFDDIARVMGELVDAPQAAGNMAKFLSDMGRTVEASAHLDRLLATGLSALPADAEWLPGAVTITEAAARLRHPVLPLAVESLRAHSGRFAFEGIGAGLHGSVDRYIALGLIALDRRAEAVPYARAALEANRAAGALLVALSQRTLADALDGTSEAMELAAAADAAFTELGFRHLARGAPPVDEEAPDGAELCRVGDVWRVTFGGTTTNVKHVKGMADLAQLLPRPGLDVHVTELEALPPEVASAARSSVRGDALDRQAVAAYRARLEELDGDLAEAEDANDIVRAERVRTERDFLLEELSSSLGLGGRSRASGPDPVERLRKAVTARVRDAIRRIDAVHPALARHLSNSIRTGTFCSYRPEQPVVWRCEMRSGA
jgi:tetratricopeptide (TPR) repeat protein